MSPLELPASELRLGDIIDLGFTPWGCAIVNQITDDIVHVFRPYGTCADFSYTGGVICYTGIENCQLFKDSKHKYTVLERKTLR